MALLRIVPVSMKVSAFFYLHARKAFLLRFVSFISSVRYGLLTSIFYNCYILLLFI